jgi:hypothetical protein
MGPDLSDLEIVVLLAELDRIIDADRFPLSPRIQILTGIRNKLRPPPPAREPLPPPKVYARRLVRIADADEVRAERRYRV